PKNNSFIFDPPEDLIDSSGPSSIPSITSDDNLPNVPIEWIPTARVPVKGPNPVTGNNTKANINSGNAYQIKGDLSAAHDIFKKIF
ncbi:MAG: hypothetical protein HN984_13585, partial [Marinovum sp.]|nr:hypothetical protein [Marinovum sp.]